MPWYHYTYKLRVAGYGMFTHFSEVERLIFCSLYSFAFLALHLYTLPYNTWRDNMSQCVQQVIVCLVFVLSTMLLALSNGDGTQAQEDATMEANGHNHTRASDPGDIRQAVCNSDHTAHTSAVNVTESDSASIVHTYAAAYHTLVVLLTGALIFWLFMFVWSVFGPCIQAIVLGMSATLQRRGRRTNVSSGGATKQCDCIVIHRSPTAWR